MRTSFTYTAGSETLQTILITSLKTLSVYEHLLKCTENPYILEWLSSKIESTSDFILDVQVELEAMGIEPRSISSLQIAISNLVYEFKYLFGLIDDQYVISACLNTDGQYLNKLSEVKNSATVTDELYQMYSSQIAAIRRKPSKQMITENILLG